MNGAPIGPDRVHYWYRQLQLARSTDDVVSEKIARRELAAANAEDSATVSYELADDLVDEADGDVDV